MSIRSFAARCHLCTLAAPIRRDSRDPSHFPESFAPLIDARTKAIYIESIGNPLGNVTDIEPPPSPTACR